MKPRLVVQQKITAFVNRYKVFESTDDAEAGQLIALAQQKRLAFKEKVYFYKDESKTTTAFTFRAEKVFDVHGRYFVEDVNGTAIGAFQKQFTKSLLNSTWTILDTEDNAVFYVKEGNMALAVLRRFIGWIPFIGDILDIVIKFFKYHFVFIDERSGEVIGKYEKTTLFRDHYTLRMTDEAYQACDWRTLAAMCVALDALQSR